MVETPNWWLPMPLKRNFIFSHQIWRLHLQSRVTLRQLQHKTQQNNMLQPSLQKNSYIYVAKMCIYSQRHMLCIWTQHQMQQLQKGQVGGSGLWPYVQQSAHLKKIKIAHNSKSQKASYVAMKISGKTNHWQAEVPSLCSFYDQNSCKVYHTSHFS